MQRITYWTLAVAIGLTRLYALSRSLWDWDEALFCTAVRHYDVATYHPHPPGFPLFILVAKIVRPVIHGDFRAIQAVTLLGAIFLFPALFALARELRFPFVVAAGAATLYAFFPPVWVFGGTAFSDIPSTTLVLCACTLLLRGAGDRRAYLLGALVLGISVGFRPQNLLFGCAPSLYATWHRIRERAWRDVAAATAIGAGIVIASYAGAAWASSSPPHGYLTAIASLRHYVRTIDSFLNPARAPLRALIVDYFVHPMRSGTVDLAIVFFAVAGLAATFRRFGTVMALLIFLPFQIFAWLMLDPFSISRYGTAYLPLYALLAAAGAHVLAWYSIDVAIIALIVARLATWTFPAVRELRSTESPPVAAMRAILRSHPAQIVFVNGSLSPFSDYFLSGVPLKVFDRDADLPMDITFAGAPYLADEGKMAAGSLKFHRDHERLWNIIRQRYFDVSITPIGAVWRFGDGWHDEEGDGDVVFRWMGSRSVTKLPPVGARARLGIDFVIPSEIVAVGPVVTVQLNGSIIDRVRCTSDSMSKSWDVAAKTDGPNELVLSIDHVLNPLRQHLGNDARDLGLELRAYRWTAIR